MADWVMEEETRAQRGSATGAGHTARTVQLREPTRHVHRPRWRRPRGGRGRRPSSPHAAWAAGAVGTAQTALASERERWLPGGGG